MIQPTTIIEEWKNNLKIFGNSPALSIKKNGKWV
jgi:hypothetical protein